jgi:ElaB/YqjD/DUF883 family membrane-anchored ribosome-binding protein
MHPSKQHTVPTEDHDAVKDRINDITCSDRNSRYGKMGGDLATDYTELIHNLKELAKRHFKNKDQTHTTFQDKIENILKDKKKKVGKIRVMIETTKIS